MLVSKGMVSSATMIDLQEWSTITMSGLRVVGTMDGGIGLPTSECLPSRSENSLYSGDSANILSRWQHISEKYIIIVSVGGSALLQHYCTIVKRTCNNASLDVQMPHLLSNALPYKHKLDLTESV